MPHRFISQLFDDKPASLRPKAIGILSFLIAANVAVWMWAWAVLHGQPLLLGTALLAYTFGLRHAVDADHIAAIDNTTRKLMQSGKRPLGVGFFFSLGHSTIVMVLAVVVAFSASALKSRFADMQAVGGIVSTVVSATFLLLLALVNVTILIGLIKAFRGVQRGEPLVEGDLDILLNDRGFLTRIFRPLFALVSKSWHMYLIGFLFGLGFDTVTEIGLFAISSGQAGHGLSLSTILIFPALFTAGMCLVDTLDGVLMIGAYGWAFLRPVRKLYYNITITAVSVVVAVLIGGIETLSMIGGALGLSGMFWSGIDGLSENFGALGYGVIGLFLGSWVLSMLAYKIKGYDELVVKIHPRKVP